MLKIKKQKIIFIVLTIVLAISLLGIIIVSALPPTVGEYVYKEESEDYKKTAKFYKIHVHFVDTLGNESNLIFESLNGRYFGKIKNHDISIEYFEKTNPYTVKILGFQNNDPKSKIYEVTFYDTSKRTFFYTFLSFFLLSILLISLQFAMYYRKPITPKHPKPPTNKERIEQLEKELQELKGSKSLDD